MFGGRLALCEYEKSRLVNKLKAARDRKSAETGRCGGRRALSETKPDVVALAQSPHRPSPKTGERNNLSRHRRKASR
jgi:hypothetical protein